MTTPIEITPAFKLSFDTIQQSNDHLLITGKAGTGKSTLLRYFRSHSTKKIAVLAPTGVAALNVNGETIHSFFRFKSNVTVENAKRAGEKLRNTAMYESLDTIIIDEISMVRADLIDCMNAFLKAVLRNNRPFGGKQMVWIGDLYQLPPVVTDKEKPYFNDVYNTPYFFSAKVIERDAMYLQYIELEKIYRQRNESFISLLNAIRKGSITNKELATINQHAQSHSAEPKEENIYLTTTNAAAAAINKSTLAQLTTPSFVHEAEYSATFDSKMAPTDLELTLKVGAQVMFVNNNNQQLWVNGTLGTIVAIQAEHTTVTVETQEGLRVSVHPHQWKMHKYVYDPHSKTLQQESAGTFTQFPLKLAWAITIHKSQGKTFKNVTIDLGRRAFSEGQVYVALSRCQSLEGVTLVRPIRSTDILVEHAITDFFEDHKEYQLKPSPEESFTSI